MKKDWEVIPGELNFEVATKTHCLVACPVCRGPYGTVRSEPGQDRNVAALRI